MGIIINGLYEKRNKLDPQNEDTEEIDSLLLKLIDISEALKKIIEHIKD